MYQENAPRVHMRLIALAALSANLLAACASVPLSDSRDDLEAKKFTVSPDVGRIYVYRTYAFVGSAVKIGVNLDGVLMGQTGLNSYLAWTVAPGRHKLGVVGFPYVIPVTVDAGKAVYVSVRPSLAGSELNQVEEAVGQKGVLGCQRARSNDPELDRFGTNTENPAEAAKPPTSTQQPVEPAQWWKEK